MRDTSRRQYTSPVLSGWRTRANWLVALLALLPVTVGAAHGTTNARTKDPIAWLRPAPSMPGAMTNSMSSNWSGYADTGRAKSFSDVKGSWIQPSISCSPSLPPENDDSFWIGLYGVTSRSVEQTGTEGICTRTTAQYDAWYEMFPRFPVVVFAIQAGDLISAEVASVSGKKFTLTLTDVTSEQRFQKTLSGGTAKRSSAEWIAEASSGCNNCLENFGSVTFSDASATESGTTGGISAFSNRAITMVARNQAVMAEPSALVGGGNSFTITWKSR
jgi:hypothetical protein